MGHLRIKANECNYKEHDRWLKEQFINGINDDCRVGKGTNQNKKTSDIMSEEVLSRAKRVQVQRAQNAMLTSSQQNKASDMTRCAKLQNKNMSNSQIITKKKKISTATWQTSQEDAQPFGRNAQDVGRTSTPRRPTRTPTEEHPKKTQIEYGAAQESQYDSDTSEREYDVVRPTAFNFNSSTSVLITNL